MFVLLAASLALCPQPVGAYSDSISLAPEDLSFSWQAGPVFPNDEGSRLGFEQPILVYQANSIQKGFKLQAFACVPTGGTGWPNVNVSGWLSYSSSVHRAISYLTWEAQGYSLSATILHDPEDGQGLACPPMGMGDALYGAGPTSGTMLLGASRFSGGTTGYTLLGPSVWAAASYSYWNNEYITDHAKVEVVATIASMDLTFYWTEISIYAAKNETQVGDEIQFFASAKDGVPPYTFYWDFGDGNSSSSQSPSKAYASPGTYTVTCTVYDSLGIMDSKSLSVVVKSYLTINPSLGGSTNPPPGNYTFSSIREVSVQAFPSSGHSFSHWVLDGGISLSNPILIATDVNHVLTPVFEAVQSEEFDFNLTKQEDITLQRGRGGNASVLLSLLSGKPEQVYLNYIWEGDVPLYTSVAIVPSTVVPTSTFSVQVYTGSSTLTGVHTLRIIGTSIGGLTRDVEITITITEAPPPATYYYLTVQPAMGGSTSPPPGVYQKPSGTTVTLSATPYSGYTFQKWTVNGVRYTSSTVHVTMDSDKSAAAVFEAQQPQPPISNGSVTVLPCNIVDGTALDRAVAYENFGVNVTGNVPGFPNTQVTVTAWLDPSGAIWYDPSTGTFKQTVYNFTQTIMTDASGRFSTAFGSLSGTFCSTNRSAPVGSQHYAYASVSASTKSYAYNSTWSIDSVNVTAEFDYNLTGVSATFRFIYATDGCPVTGRSGYYMASLEGAYSALAGGTLNASRLSTPCDVYGVSALYVPYEEMNASTLRSLVEVPIWSSLWDGTVFRATWLPANRITYTVLAPVVYHSNSTCIVVEVVDWGERESLTGVPGVHLVLYCGDYTQPFNGTRGLLGYYGPTSWARLVREGDGTCIEMTASGTGFGYIPVDGSLEIPETKIGAEIAVALATYVALNERAGGGGADGLWLQLVPGHTSLILYNPIREGRILILGGV